MKYLLHSFNFFVFIFMFFSSVYSQTRLFQDEHKLFGLKDENGKIIIPAKFNWADYIKLSIPLGKSGHTYKSETDPNKRFIQVKLNGYYGIYNHAGEEVLPIQNVYVDLRYSSDFLCIYRSNTDQIGFVNLLTREKYELPYEQLSSFSEGKAAVMKDGAWGFINAKGKLILPLNYGNSFGFSENLALVGGDNKYGFIDTTGKYVIPIQYDYAEAFDEGTAYVKIGGKWNEIHDHQDGKWGVINAKGEIVVPIEYDLIWKSTNVPNLFRVNKGAYWQKDCPCTRGGLWALYDSNQKKEITPFIYEKIEPFYEGVAEASKNGKFGYIDEKGNEITPFIYDYTRRFENGKASVNKDNKIITIYKTSKNNVIYSKIHTDYDGLCRVMNENKYGFIDAKTEEVKIPLIYSNAMDFNNGYAVVTVGGTWEMNGTQSTLTGGKMGLINSLGEMVIPANYLQLKSYNNGFVLFHNGKGFGFLNLKGEVVIPEKFEDAYPFSENLAAVQMNGKWGYIDTKGEIQIECQFDSVSLTGFSNGKAKVYKGSESFYINKKGEKIPD